jgi:integrase
MTNLLPTSQTKKSEKVKSTGNGSGTIYQRGEKWCWQLSMYQGLKRVTVSGTCDNRTKARAALAKAITRREHGELVAPDKMTFSEWLDKWLESKRPHIRANTYIGYKNDIKHRIKPGLGHIKLQALKPIHLKGFYDDLANKKVLVGGSGKRKTKEGNRTLSPSSQRQVHIIIHGALKEALKLELIHRNVADTVKPQIKKDENSKASSAWSVEEATTFLAFAKPERHYPLFYVMLSLGLRRGEALGLRWSNIDLVNGTIKIVETLIAVDGKATQGLPKTKKGRRVIKLPFDVVDVLKAHRANQTLEHQQLQLSPAKDWVFTSFKGTPLAPDSIDGTMRRISNNASVRQIRVHDLRHTYASLARRQGVGLEVLSERLGHSKPSFTADVYRHVLEDELDHAALPLATLLSPRVGMSN